MGRGRRAGIAVLLTAAVPLGIAFAAGPDPDPSFGTGGTTSSAGGGTSGQAAALVLRPGDGPAVLGSVLTDGFGTRGLSFVRFDADGTAQGTLTAGFAAGTATFGAGLARQSTGALVGLGTSDACSAPVVSGLTDPDCGINGYAQVLAVARSTPAGTLDPSFYASGTTPGQRLVPFGTATSDAATAAGIAVDGADRIVAAGSLDRGGSPRMIAVRLSPDGADSGTLSVGRLELVPVAGESSGVGDVAITADDGIVLAGWTQGAARRMVVVRLTPAGNLDTAFGGGDGLVVEDLGAGDDEGTAIAVAADGRLVVAARAGTGAAVVRLLPDGSRDTTFGTNGVAPVTLPTGTAIPAAVSLHPSGQPVVAGSLGTGGFIAALDRTGGADTTFAPVVLAAVPLVGVALQPDGRVVAAGTDGGGRFVVTRRLGDGPPTAALVLPDGLVAGAVGLFDGSNSTDAEGAIARFEWDLDGDGTYEVDTGPDPILRRAVEAVGTRAVGLRVSDDKGRTDTTSKPLTVAAPPPGEPPAPILPPGGPSVPPVVDNGEVPELGKTVALERLSGSVLVRLKGEKEFRRVSAADVIPFGATIQAKRGRARFTVENGRRNGFESLDYYSGRFTIGQRRNGLTTAAIVDKGLGRCPNAGKAGRSAEPQGVPGRASASASKSKKGRGAKPVRRLWGSGKGKFRTKGRYAAGTVRGTRWLVEDFCNGTLVTVKSGVVNVRNFASRRVIGVPAGRSYFARSPFGG